METLKRGFSPALMWYFSLSLFHLKPVGSQERHSSCHLLTSSSIPCHAKLFSSWFKLNPPTPLWRWRRAYWGANSYTKCLITFVNVAVAISALAGGGGPNRISHRDLVLVVFACFFDDFWVSELKRVLKRNFGSFWSASGKGKTDRNEKAL